MARALAIDLHTYQVSERGHKALPDEALRRLPKVARYAQAVLRLRPTCGWMEDFYRTSLDDGEAPERLRAHTRSCSRCQEDLRIGHISAPRFPGALGFVMHSIERLAAAIRAWRWRHLTRS